MTERRHMVEYAKDTHAVSERRACQVLSLHRSTFRYQSINRSAQPVYQRVIGLSEQYDYWGYRKITDLVHREGLSVGRERVRKKCQSRNYLS